MQHLWEFSCQCLTMKLSYVYKMANLAVSSSLLVRLSIENPLSDIQVNLLTVLTLNSVNDHIYVCALQHYLILSLPTSLTVSNN